MAPGKDRIQRLVAKQFASQSADTFTAASGFIGDLTGNVTGDVTGNVTGDVTGNLTGTATGSKVTTSSTITSATPSTTRLIHGAITCTPTSTFAVSAGGSLAGVRGEVTVTALKSFTDGFLYGAQGKVTLAGTIAEASAARITGVLGQTDLASGTVTAGQVSGLWADLQGSPTLTVPDQVFPLRVTNSMSVNAYAMAFYHGKATAFMSINEPSVSFVSAVTPAAATGSIKILVNGDVRYLLYTDDPTA